MKLSLKLHQPLADGVKEYVANPGADINCRL
jgi:hypothetical protein